MIPIILNTIDWIGVPIVRLIYPAYPGQDMPGGKCLMFRQ
jgi:hypothetical protein